MVYILGFFFGGVKASQKPRHMSSRILGKMLSSWKAIDTKMYNQSKGNCGGLPPRIIFELTSYSALENVLLHHWIRIVSSLTFMLRRKN